MAAVLLTILKVIGIVLASVVGLALLIIAIVLFVPIRYRISADRSDPDKDPTLNIRISFLLHLLTAGFVYDNGTDKFAKVLWIKIWPKEEKEAESDTPEDSPTIEGLYEHLATEGDGTQAAEDTESVNEASSADDTAQSEPEEPYTIDWNDPEEPSDDDKDDEETDSLWSKIEAFIDRIIEKKKSYEKKYKKLRREIRFWDKMRLDRRNRDAVELIKVNLVKLLKKIAPRSVKGFVHFGFEDPATTGRVLAYVAMIYPVLPQKLIIDPGFEDTDTLIYGKADIKGRLPLIVPGIAFCRIYFNDDCRRMWRIYKRHKDK